MFRRTKATTVYNYGPALDSGIVFPDILVVYVYVSVKSDSQNRP